jgi:spore maturation protein CgeB
MRCDVLVLGHAHPDRIEPVRALRDRFETHVYGEGWEEHGIPSRGLIFGDDVLAALNSARMSTVFLHTMGGHRLVKVGLFDFAAAGALVVANRSDDVVPYLRYGEEIVGFESTDELLEQVAYHLAHPEQAERIRRAGRARVLRDHTWQVTWPRIFDTVRALRSRAQPLRAAARP